MSEIDNQSVALFHGQNVQIFYINIVMNLRLKTAAK